MKLRTCSLSKLGAMSKLRLCIHAIHCACILMGVYYRGFQSYVRTQMLMCIITLTTHVLNSMYTTNNTNYTNYTCTK